MRTGLFCTYENPQSDYGSAYADQAQLVQLVEQLGFDDAWVAEHHFNPNAASPSCLSILSHLAALTSRIRLGSAAVLLPFRNPILVAEDVATLDILSRGRFDFGAAKGGPFPIQNKHFGVAAETSRGMAIEALSLIERLLSEDEVNFAGQYFKAEGISLSPKPLQSPVPIFFATSSAEAVARAARHGYGLMGGPPFPFVNLRASLNIYRETAPQGDAKLVLIRFYHVAATGEQARAEAATFLQSFVERLQATTACMQPDWTSWLKLERMIDDSLIGSASEIHDKVLRIQHDLAPRSLILKPLSPSLAKRRADLELFAAEIQPSLRIAA
ncbi:LLM class flavin-dependent oxidoreductase [Methylocapsa acidiphila]|uniref:LLM class flavin-dependent oxidoreductase n=1 Tax=Methylocapsa acidiphila TaxID=133552 RepID=UPI00047BC837|nr:LLM class flavin-dependent oxidoreductase [Methylocapsa acidiphila]